LQSHTLAIVEKLRSLSPAEELNEWLVRIIAEGTGKTFSPEHNKNWLDVTRPILEAFFHARFFLEIGREIWTRVEASAARHAERLGGAALLV
jgi:hypothetical protein